MQTAGTQKGRKSQTDQYRCVYFLDVNLNSDYFVDQDLKNLHNGVGLILYQYLPSKFLANKYATLKLVLNFLLPLKLRK